MKKPNDSPNQDNKNAYLMLRLSILLLSFMTHTATSALIWGASHNPVVASKER